MVGNIVLLLVLWIIGGIIGLVVKGLVWLFWASLVLFAITFLVGIVKGILAKSTKS
mgnify:CR=1 FL=1